MSRTMKTTMRATIGVGLFIICSYYMTYGHSSNSQERVCNLVNAGRTQDKISKKVSSEWTMIQTARLTRVKRTCSQYRAGQTQSPIKIQYERLIVSEKYKLVYCPIEKVSSQTWRKRLMKMSTNGTATKVEPGQKGSGLRKLSSYSLEERKKILSTYFKFFFVRHPLTRIVSAYREKLEGSMDEKTWAPIRKRMIEFYATKRHTNISKEIRFEKFLTYMLYAKVPHDTHWRSYYKSCAPCVISYDFVGKMETLSEDTEFLHQTILRDMYPERYNNQHPTFSSINVSAEYYKNISIELKIDLLEHLKQDIQMFGYDYRKLFTV